MRSMSVWSVRGKGREGRGYRVLEGIIGLWERRVEGVLTQAVVIKCGSFWVFE